MKNTQRGLCYKGPVVNSIVNHRCRPSPHIYLEYRYIPGIMGMVCILLCFSIGRFHPYPSGLHYKPSKGPCSASDATLKNIWGLRFQKQVSQAGISNYIPQFTVGCNYLSLSEIPASGAKVLIKMTLLGLEGWTVYGPTRVLYLIFSNVVWRSNEGNKHQNNIWARATQCTISSSYVSFVLAWKRPEESPKCKNQ